MHGRRFVWLWGGLQGDSRWKRNRTVQLHRRCGGAAPQRGLLLDAKGNLYGTTPSGGTHGFGTVFKEIRTVTRPSYIPSLEERTAGIPTRA